MLRTKIIANLRVYDFVTIRSRGSTAYSVLSVSVDGQHILGLSIAGDVQPNSGNNVIAAFSSKSEKSIVGWVDPVTHAPVVTNSKIVTYHPIILVILFPLLSISLILSRQKYGDIVHYLACVLFISLMLLPFIGRPGVKRHLLKAQAQSEHSLP